MDCFGARQICCAFVGFLLHKSGLCTKGLDVRQNNRAIARPMKQTEEAALRPRPSRRMDARNSFHPSRRIIRGRSRCVNSRGRSAPLPTATLLGPSQPPGTGGSRKGFAPLIGTSSGEASLIGADPAWAADDPFADKAAGQPWWCGASAPLGAESRPDWLPMTEGPSVLRRRPQFAAVPCGSRSTTAVTKQAW